MRVSGLTFDSMPPLAVPLRFFLTAPLFGLLAALLLVSGGTAVWTSRWHPDLLATTHLLTLGFMTMVMFGALFQLLPVLSGRALLAADLVAPWIHAALALGALSLAAGFAWQQPLLWSLAAGLLASAGLGFLAALLPVLWRRGGGDSIFAMRVAALGLLGTLGIGIYLVLGRIDPSLGVLLYTFPTDAHASWGLVGWAAVLVMGVSYQIIPMFHVAPPFPRWLARGAVLLVLLGLLPAGHRLGSGLVLVAETLSTTGLVGWAICSLLLLRRRKRRRAEAMIHSWQLGLGCLCAALLYNWLRRHAGLSLPWVPAAASDLVVGVLMILGFAVTVIEGMLQKIVPFLSFLHLQRAVRDAPEKWPRLPSMADFVPDWRARGQLGLHAAALALALGAVTWPGVGPYASVLLAADFAWLGCSLLLAARHYRRCLRSLTG